MDYRKLLMAAGAFTALSFILYAMGSFIDMGYYTDPANAALWSRLMMPSDAAPPLSFFILSLLFTFISALIYSAAYDLVKPVLRSKKSFRQEKYWQAGLRFGMLLFLLANLGGFMSMVLLLALPFGLQVSWLLQGLVASLLGGIVIAKFMD